jgi:hypothetical protein
MSHDDWEPLPPEVRIAHPGEVAGPAPRARAATAAGPAPLPPAAGGENSPPRPTEPASPAALAAFTALQQKLALRPASRSLVAAVMQDQSKRARRQRAIANPDCAATLVQLDVPAPTPEVVYRAGPDGRDEREDSDWFVGLPAPEQARLRTQWQRERLRFAKTGRLWWLRLRRAACHGALVLGGLGILQSLLLGGFQLVPAMALAGAVAAGVAMAVRGDRFVYALLGGLAWVIVMGPVVLVQPFAMPGLLLAAYGMGAVGMEGEMRRSGGFRDD